MKLFSIPIILLVAAPISLGFLPSSNSETLSSPGLRSNQVMVFRAVPFEVKPGSTLRIDGSGFSKTLNKVYFNSKQVASTVSLDGTSLTIFIPRDISEGEYRISVLNSFGLSDTEKFPVSVKVTSKPAPAPVVKSAYFSNNNVTLMGLGFTRNNYISSTLGDLSGPVSPSDLDGSLSFDIRNLALYSKAKEASMGRSYSVALWVFVRNEHGVSQDPYQVDINI